MVKDVKQTVVEEVRKTVGEELYCDGCSELLGRRKVLNFGYHQHKPIGYYHVTTGHHDWGNDSVDSISECDYCPRCLYKAFNDYMSRSKGDNTEYMDIEHEIFMSEETSEWQL